MFALKNPSTVATSKVVTPVLSLEAGEYSAAQTVTVSCATPGVNIYYTVDNTEPSATNGTLYTGTIAVNSSATVKVIAIKDGMINSDVVSAKYTITPGA